jgi:hypothetical protein
VRPEDILVTCGFLHHHESRWKSASHPEVEKMLADLAAQSGRNTDEVLQEALVGYFDEVMQARRMLDNRYDQLKSGTVKPLDGKEALARLKAKNAAQRRK